MRELALFAGAGGGILGGLLLGWRTVCAVELDPYCRSVLLARQRDGILPRFPIWDDIKTFDGRPWNGEVDVISAGFPCQDISWASGTGTGIDGERSGLWREVVRIVRDVRPRHVLVENSPALTARGLGRVLSDLAALGFDAEWDCLSGSPTEQPHKGERLFLLATTNKLHGGPWMGDEPDGLQAAQSAPARAPWGGGRQELSEIPIRIGMESLAAAGGVADGVAHRVDRVAAIGNGQVPIMVERAWKGLST